MSYIGSKTQDESDSGVVQGDEPEDGEMVFPPPPSSYDMSQLQKSQSDNCEIQELRNKVTSCESQVEMLEKEKKDLIVEVEKNKVMSNHENLRTKVAEKEKENATLRNTVTSLEAKIEEVEKRKKNTEDQLAKAIQIIASAHKMNRLYFFIIIALVILYFFKVSLD